MQYGKVHSILWNGHVINQTDLLMKFAINHYELGDKFCELVV